MSAPAFVYVAPARYEDILKLGFSHDPCERIRSFHPRWFDYFDLDRAFVLAATDEKDARRIERILAATLVEHRARAPLVIEQAAGGYTEWYRGAYPGVCDAAAALVREGGYAPLEPLLPRMRQRLLAEREQWFERCVVMVDAIEASQGEPQSQALTAGLRVMLDAYAALQIEIEAHLPTEIAEWLRRHGLMQRDAQRSAEST